MPCPGRVSCPNTPHASRRRMLVPSHYSASQHLPIGSGPLTHRTNRTDWCHVEVPELHCPTVAFELHRLGGPAIVKFRNHHDCCCLCALVARVLFDFELGLLSLLDPLERPKRSQPVEGE